MVVMDKSLWNLRRKIQDYEWILIEFLINIFPFFRKLTLRYTNYRNEIVKKEISMTNISSNDKVLFIGCGPFPYTAIAIADIACANVVAIDKSTNAIKIASSYIHQEKLSRLIKIEYGNGTNYPLKDFNVIILSFTIWPIESILNHIFYNINTQTRVICRDYKNNVKDIIKNSNLSELCMIKSFIDHPAGAKYKSLLLKKNLKDNICL